MSAKNCSTYFPHTPTWRCFLLFSFSLSFWSVFWKTWREFGRRKLRAFWSAHDPWRWKYSKRAKVNGKMTCVGGNVVLCTFFSGCLSVSEMIREGERERRFECVNIVWIRMSLLLAREVVNKFSRDKVSSCLLHERHHQRDSQRQRLKLPNLWVNVTEGWLWNIFHTFNMKLYRVYHEIFISFTFHMRSARGFPGEKKIILSIFDTRQMKNEDVFVYSTETEMLLLWGYHKQKRLLMRKCRVN